MVHLLAASMAIERPPASTSMTPAFLTDPELATVDDESLGGLGAVEVAAFGLDGLDRLTAIAAASDEGILRLRAGLNGFQQRRADGTVTLMLATDDPAVAQRRLDQALSESGRIEGYSSAPSAAPSRARRRPPTPHVVLHRRGRHRGGDDGAQRPPRALLRQRPAAGAGLDAGGARPIE